MAHSAVHRWTSLILFLVVTSSAKEQSRWSRQISSYTADISDWVPLSGPVEREDQPQIKRQAVAEPRILTEPFPGLPRPSGFSSETFPSRNYFSNSLNRPLYLQSVPSVPSAPQNYLTDQGFGQSIRFGLSQPNFPLNQAFVSQQFGYDGLPGVSQNVPQSIPQIKQSVPQSKPSVPQLKLTPQPIPSNPIKFDYTKTSPQLPAIPVKSYNNQVQKPKPDAPKFIDGYRIENSSNDFTHNQKKKPQSLQKIKFDYEKPASKPEGLQNIPKPQSKVEREEVQLLYVPLESLNRGQFNFRSPLTSTQILNSELYSQGVAPQKNTMTELHRPIVNPVENNNPQLQNYFTEFNSQFNTHHSQQHKELDQVPKFSTLSTPFPTSLPTSPKPKKLKPHQPPLAIFLTEDASKNNQIKVGDVLASLKTANSVAVLDSVNPLNAPKVFIGPSSLQPPARYVKFELPYLSNIENSDKKLRQLPFFVAPLSYNTPQGFAKIPFPSPHVGSVVINAQIRETSTQGPSAENVKPNYYTGSYNREQKPLVTQKPTFSFYSTAAPKTNRPENYQSNYYQFEPQTVSTIKPSKEPETVPPGRAGNYFLSNTGNRFNSEYETSHYNPTHYEEQHKYNYQSLPEPVKTHPVQQRIETTTTHRTTVTTTTKPPSTYPSQLLETHNPYYINQAFQYNSPLDYRSYMDEYKEPLATPVATATPATPQKPASTSPTPKVEELVTEKPRYQQQSSPIYQSYTPEVHYESEVQNQRYPVYNNNEYTYTTKAAQQNQESQYDDVSSPVVQQIQPTQEVQPIQQVAPVQQIKPYQQSQSTNPEYNIPATNPSNTEFISQTQETETLDQNETPKDNIYNKPALTDVQNQQNYEYNRFEENLESNTQASSTTTTTSTTTKRPVRGRGRPRYTTTPRSDSGEYTTRTVTRRPFKERRPLPSRPRYEPNRITTEKSTRKPYDNSEESTTKSTRTRNRGRVTYKPSDDDYDRRKTHSSKEQDLAYQRDVLHQNYPVTLMERTSTVDIEAITEPTIKLSANGEPSDNLDTENAYTYERASISQQYPTIQLQQQESEEDIPVFPSRTTVSQRTSYVPRLSTRDEEYVYQSRSSSAPAEQIVHEEPLENDDNKYLKPTTPIQKEISDIVESTTQVQQIFSQEQKEQVYSENEGYLISKEEEIPTTTETQAAKTESQEFEEENVVQTTPSYNRVRVRPGVIKQYHQASSKESSRIKADQKRPVTYRPAFDRRRTTMRIDEIQQDLKTKQVHGRPEHDEYRHPVYKPETSTDATSTQEITTKRGAFRQRRPNYSYTTTSTEGSQRKYERRNRYRGRRPTTEKPTDRTEVQADSTTTNRPIYSRYSHRPKLSERYNKKPEPEETEDQDSNFSINRPTYAAPDTNQWSSDSFKPYNPNTIADEEKLTTTERRSDRVEVDIITARNEYDDILISVTPATNNINNKKLPDIPPTLEALVEQSKVTKSDSNDQMSTFESMLEEVMKSLEEQDEDEYTSNVMKHKGGEIGEIPPERIITSGESYTTKATMTAQEETTTLGSEVSDHPSEQEEETEAKTRRRGFWKRVKVRPVATESIEAAESQYYTNTVNKLGQPVSPSKSMHDKSVNNKKVSVTTYKPAFHYIKDVFSDAITAADVVPTVEISKISTPASTEDKYNDLMETTAQENEIQTERTSPGDLDLGTGSPDPALDDSIMFSTVEPTTTKPEKSSFSLMDYLFGTGEGTDAKTEIAKTEIEITTEAAKIKTPTTETTFMPEEITEIDESAVLANIKKINATEMPKDFTTTEMPIDRQETTQSTFMNPANILSTSISTEMSQETEICFRGKCIKTFKDISRK